MHLMEARAIGNSDPDTLEAQSERPSAPNPSMECEIYQPSLNNFAFEGPCHQCPRRSLSRGLAVESEDRQA